MLPLVAAAALVAASAAKSRPQTAKALRIGTKQFLAVLPFFLAVFGAVGLLEILLAPSEIESFLGSGRGLLAPLYAAILGGLATGPPAAVYPLGKYLLAQHAGVAAVGTLLIAWVAVGTVSLPVEIRFFGARFALARWVLTMVVSIVLGVIMGLVL